MIKHLMINKWNVVKKLFFQILAKCNIQILYILQTHLRHHLDPCGGQTDKIEADCPTYTFPMHDHKESSQTLVLGLQKRLRGPIDF